MTTDASNNTHVFLSKLPEQERIDRITALPEWRIRELAARSFPGTPVGGLEWHEALAEGGLDFEVEERPLCVQQSHVWTSPVETHKAVVRADTNEPVGIVGKGYGLIQNSELLGGIKSLVDNQHATLESVWCEDGGAKVGAAALIGRYSIPARLGADRPESFAEYILAGSSHDGSGSYYLERYSLQLVCFNGATNQTRESRLSVRHTRNAATYAAEANQALHQFIEDAIAEQELYARFGQDALRLEEFVAFANELLVLDRGEADTDLKAARREKDVTELADLFEEGRGCHGASKLDAISAVTEWLTPRREQYADAAKFARKFATNQSGAAAKTRKRALRLLGA